MDNKYYSITIKLLAFIFGIFLAVTLLGCNDSIVSDMETQHRELSLIAKQELRQSSFNFQTDSHDKALNPAPQIK